MKRYFVEIDLKNDTFKHRAAPELARILRELADKVELFSFLHEKSIYPIRDSNGNIVGHHGYEIREDA